MRSYDRSCAVRFLIFHPTDPRNTDRPNHESCDKTVRVYNTYKKLTFWKFSYGRGFWEAEKARIFRASAASKGMFTDSYSYWQRTIDTWTWTVRFWNLERLLLSKSSAAFYVYLFLSFEVFLFINDIYKTWKKKQTKPQNHESHETTKVC